MSITVIYGSNIIICDKKWERFQYSEASQNQEKDLQWNREGLESGG